VELDDPDHPLTLQTIGPFRNDLLTLGDYLWTNARLIFYSCIAGKGQQGSGPLNELSRNYFDGRHVIGFEMYG
jgi:hypothetical protein